MSAEPALLDPGARAREFMAERLKGIGELPERILAPALAPDG
ncbi:hypothetical protein [Paraburkholderia sp. SG-MS1]|nr:hypothetical protein [Paraburkholderia sp. SG-MS1]